MSWLVTGAIIINALVVLFALALLVNYLIFSRIGRGGR